MHTIYKKNTCARLNGKCDYVYTKRCRSFLVCFCIAAFVEQMCIVLVCGFAVVVHNFLFVSGFGIHPDAQTLFAKWNCLIPECQEIESVGKQSFRYFRFVFNDFVQMVNIGNVGIKSPTLLLLFSLWLFAFSYYSLRTGRASKQDGRAGRHTEWSLAMFCCVGQ